MELIIEIITGFVLGYCIFYAFSFVRNVLGMKDYVAGINSTVKEVVVLHLTELVNTTTNQSQFLVYRGGTKEFLFQSASMAEIAEKIKSTFNDTPVMVMSENFNALALVMDKEIVK